MDRHTIAHYVIGATAVLLGGSGLYQAHHKTPDRIVALSPAPFVGTVTPSRRSWDGLGQDKTIKMGEALANTLRAPGARPDVTIYCNSQDCDAFARDLDDAFQIADWPSDLERAFVESQSQTGVFIGPPHDAAAMEIANALLKIGIVPQWTEMPGPGIVIGKKP